jgi:flagellar hook-basal body complex protein FliE
MDNLSLAAHLRSLANPVGGPLGDRALGDRPLGEVPPGTKPFADVLREQVSEVNALQNEADQSIGDLVTGKSDDIHATMIALQKADVSFRLLMAVRNKLLDAYDEVMRMQI